MPADEIGWIVLIAARFVLKLEIIWHETESVSFDPGSCGVSAFQNAQERFVIRDHFERSTMYVQMELLCPVNDSQHFPIRL